MQPFTYNLGNYLWVPFSHQIKTRKQEITAHLILVLEWEQWKKPNLCAKIMAFLGIIYNVLKIKIKPLK